VRAPSTGFPKTSKKIDDLESTSYRKKTLEELKMKPEAASGLAESIINIVQ